MAAQRRLDQRLALLDLAGAGFGRGGQAADSRSGAKKSGGGEAGPGDEAEEDEEEDGLDRGGHAETAKLATPSWTNRSRSRNNADVAAKT